MRRKSRGGGGTEGKGKICKIIKKKGNNIGIYCNGL